ncbi:MAG: hypothetical protein JXA19_03550 [Anaerolineales bacterium]|nr:hypothetical protein [Anaerolineales bacterium]
MVTRKGSNSIILIGHDKGLHYLLDRYLEQTDIRMVSANSETLQAEIDRLNPIGLVFLSPEFINFISIDLTLLNIPVIVFGNGVEETYLKEKGVDICLQHPLTFDEFFHKISGFL